jgi:ribonuclease R
MIDKRAVLKLLRDDAQRPLKPKEMARALGVDPREYAHFKRLLREMEDSGELYRVRKKRYALPQRINLIVGRLQMTRAGHGFVVPDDGKGDVFVPATELGNAYEGDQVVARIERRRRGKNPEGSIVKVLERARSQIVGVFHRSGRVGFVVPDELKMRRDVFIPRESEGAARDGDVAVARVLDWGSDHQDPVGEIVEVLGRPGDPGVDVLTVVHDHGLPTTFPQEVVQEAETLAQRRPEEEDLKKRTDFRSVAVPACI